MRQILDVFPILSQACGTKVFSFCCGCSIWFISWSLKGIRLPDFYLSMGQNLAGNVPMLWYIFSQKHQMISGTYASNYVCVFLRSVICLKRRAKARFITSLAQFKFFIDMFNICSFYKNMAFLPVLNDHLSCKTTKFMGKFIQVLL